MFEALLKDQGTKPSPNSRDIRHDELTANEIMASRLSHTLNAIGLRDTILVDVNGCEGHVTLRGRVERFFEKQLAQETMMRDPEVERLTNHIVVSETKNVKEAKR